jgi:hypothetical protein
VVQVDLDLLRRAWHFTGEISEAVSAQRDARFLKSGSHPAADAVDIARLGYCDGVAHSSVSTGEVSGRQVAAGVSAVVGVLALFVLLHGLNNGDCLRTLRGGPNLVDDLLGEGFFDTLAGY